MSWIFSFLLACYACVRLVLWTRGQVRWLSIRRTLPVPPTEVAAPEQLSAGLARLFLACIQLRAQLVHARRMLVAVEITDPDASLGHVRDARYRRAVMESWTHLNAWLRGISELDEAELLVLRDKGLGHEAIASMVEGMREHWRAASRARALDPFAMTDLLAIKRTFERVEAELLGIERGLVEMGEDPYRDRFAEQHDLATVV